LSVAIEDPGSYAIIAPPFRILLGGVKGLVKWLSGPEECTSACVRREAYRFRSRRSFSLDHRGTGLNFQGGSLFLGCFSLSVPVSVEDVWPKAGIAEGDETRRITKALTAVSCDLGTEMRHELTPFAEPGQVR
jgi:hypothetical protein